MSHDDDGERRADHAPPRAAFYMPRPPPTSHLPPSDLDVGTTTTSLRRGPESEAVALQMQQAVQAQRLARMPDVSAMQLAIVPQAAAAAEPKAVPGGGPKFPPKPSVYPVEPQDFYIEDARAEYRENLFHDGNPGWVIEVFARLLNPPDEDPDRRIYVPMLPPENEPDASVRLWFQQEPEMQRTYNVREMDHDGGVTRFVVHVGHAGIGDRYGDYEVELNVAGEDSGGPFDVEIQPGATLVRRQFPWPRTPPRVAQLFHITHTRVDYAPAEYEGDYGTWTLTIFARLTNPPRSDPHRRLRVPQGEFKRAEAAVRIQRLGKSTWDRLNVTSFNHLEAGLTEFKVEMQAEDFRVKFGWFEVELILGNVKSLNRDSFEIVDPDPISNEDEEEAEERGEGEPMELGMARVGGMLSRTWGSHTVAGEPVITVTRLQPEPGQINNGQAQFRVRIRDAAQYLNLDQIPRLWMMPAVPLPHGAGDFRLAILEPMSFYERKPADGSPSEWVIDYSTLYQFEGPGSQWIFSTPLTVGICTGGECVRLRDSIFMANYVLDDSPPAAGAQVTVGGVRPRSAYDDPIPRHPRVPYMHIVGAVARRVDTHFGVPGDTYRVDVMARITNPPPEDPNMTLLMANVPEGTGLGVWLRIETKKANDLARIQCRWYEDDETGLMTFHFDAPIYVLGTGERRIWIETRSPNRLFGPDVVFLPEERATQAAADDDEEDSDAEMGGGRAAHMGRGHAGSTMGRRCHGKASASTSAKISGGFAIQDGPYYSINADSGLVELIYDREDIQLCVDLDWDTWHGKRKRFQRYQATVFLNGRGYHVKRLVWHPDSVVLCVAVPVGDLENDTEYKITVQVDEERLDQNVSVLALHRPEPDWERDEEDGRLVRRGEGGRSRDRSSSMVRAGHGGRVLWHNDAGVLEYLPPRVTSIGMYPHSRSYTQPGDAIIQIEVQHFHVSLANLAAMKILIGERDYAPSATLRPSRNGDAQIFEVVVRADDDNPALPEREDPHLRITLKLDDEVIPGRSRFFFYRPEVDNATMARAGHGGLAALRSDVSLYRATVDSAQIRYYTPGTGAIEDTFVSVFIWTREPETIAANRLRVWLNDIDYSENITTRRGVTMKATVIVVTIHADDRRLPDISEVRVTVQLDGTTLDRRPWFPFHYTTGEMIAKRRQARRTIPMGARATIGGMRRGNSISNNPRRPGSWTNSGDRMYGRLEVQQWYDESHDMAEARAVVGIPQPPRDTEDGIPDMQLELRPTRVYRLQATRCQMSYQGVYAFDLDTEDYYNTPEGEYVARAVVEGEPQPGEVHVNIGRMDSPVQHPEEEGDDPIFEEGEGL